MAKILEIWELQAALTAIIETTPVIVAKVIPVFADTGRNKPQMDKGLRNKGIIVRVEPVFAAQTRQQDDSQCLLDVSIFATVICNPEVDIVDQASDLDPQKLVSDVIKTVCGYPKKPGAERFRVGTVAFEMSRTDDGLVVYNIQFVKEATP